MAGHSHWARIKRKKGVLDARRGRLWSKLSRHIIVAARAGGGNPAENLSLRYAIEKAKAANMPADTIDRAIKKGAGGQEGVAWTEIKYEGYAPGGVALLIEALTDNPNRTAPEIRSIFEKHGGNLGSTNCVAWQFRKKGVLSVAESDATEDQLMELALEVGAEDVRRQEDVFEIITEPAAYEPLRQALASRNITTQTAELSMIPDNTVAVDVEAGQRIMKLIEALEDNEDVQNVYSNADIPEGVEA